MSADGRYLAWLSSGTSAPSLVLFDVRQGREVDRVGGTPARVRAFTWSHAPGVGIAVADRTGAENWVLYRFTAGTREWTPLAEVAGAQMRVAGLSPRRPTEVLVASNRRDRRCHDYEVISLRTGDRVMSLENNGYGAVYFDTDFSPRLTETVNQDGSRDFWHSGHGKEGLFLHVPHEAALCTRFSHFSTDGHTAYFVLPDGREGTRLAGLRCAGDQRATVAETLLSVRWAGIGQILPSSTTGRPELAEVERFRRRTVALHADAGTALRALRRRLGGEPAVLERRQSDGQWLCAEHRADAEARYFVYRPSSDVVTPVVRARPAPRGAPLTCRPVSVALRAGRHAVTFLAAPTPGKDSSRDTPPPAVLLVHGGPWRRSRWEYDERRVWLARQGYTVLDPNFRGSTGFGSAWVNAADREWGAAMQEDLEDTLDWAVRRGHADPDRIALVGGSYGGYAVLQLAATSSRRFGCVVATAPLTDLVRFADSLPEYWQTAAPMVRRRLGDAGDPVQRSTLAERSPVTNAATVECPVLLVHGANDSRVPVDMSTTMFMRLARADRAALLALFPDEGHELVRAENRLACDRLTAAFLSRHVLGTGAEATTPESSTMRLLRTPRYRAPARHEYSQGVSSCWNQHGFCPS
ncbi:alpha/beta hydrolase family protein [Amycolatopsis cihanbeyliensis]|uniref:Dipeptidyl aminopeptidase/acylaminoacyl peptidase n=1 Tax=Amycolatopsis cihanbeyliensis TaxID=1128664 RepID=A0A542DDD5_AMYCI|nr:alpha/beta fold hydrolase [Amycolatopsis cihanbeyliensis]TQJ01073.1 dipeptidyl aminopeptidase/acylaminoacyl peptidase [Amycolatopsis cihanbeyliensis]